MDEEHRESITQDIINPTNSMEMNQLNDKPKIALADEPPAERLSRWRLRTITVALCLSIFLSTLEISIVSTSLVAITNSLQSFGQSSWIVTSYLLTYTGFLIIWAKISDILGRKLCVSTAILTFMVFSGACGAAQTTVQLIIFRLFQGIGGSGIVSMTFVIIPEMVPPAQYGTYASITAGFFAASYLLGPLVGGVITDRSTWRWVFLINPPAGLIALVLVMISLPAGFPHTISRKTSTNTRLENPFSKIDFLGAFLLFAAFAFLVAALEEAGTQYSWSSPIIIIFLVLSGLFWICFVGWERILSRRNSTQEAMFPWDLIKHRIYMGNVLITFLAGIPFTVAIIQIPQRFQVVNGTSATKAGIGLLPFTLCASLGSFLSSILATKVKVPPVFIVFIGGVFQLIGAALMSTLSTAQEISASNYGYQVLLSTGIGLNIGVLIIVTPNIIRGKNQAVAMGGIQQFRALGGVLGLAIATTALNDYVRSRLSNILSVDQLALFLESSATIALLPPDLQTTVRTTYGEGFNLQMRVMIGFSAAQILALALVWERNLRRVA